MSWYNIQKYRCRKCLSSFKTERQLKNHMKDKHSVYPSGLTCPNCGDVEMIMDYAGEFEQCPCCHWKES